MPVAILSILHSIFSCRVWHILCSWQQLSDAKNLVLDLSGINRTIGDCMNWIAILPAILTAVTGIALTVTAVLNWQTAKINRDKARLDSDKTLVELYMTLKKAGQDIAASSGTIQKPAYKEDAPPKPSKLSKWFLFLLIASILINIGMLHYLTYTAPLTTYTIGSMLISTFWVIVITIILVHRLIDSRINDESAWMRWAASEQFHLTVDSFIGVFQSLIDVNKVVKLQTATMEHGILGVYNLAKLQADATAQGLHGVHDVVKLQKDATTQGFLDVVDATAHGFTEVKILIGNMAKQSQ